MKDLFIELSNEEEGKYEVIHEKRYSPYIFLPFAMKENGVQIKLLKLDIIYQHQLIEVSYKMSNNHLGIISCSLEESLYVPDFAIVNKSHYSRIFNKQNNILAIKCKESYFGKFLEKKLKELDLENIARKSQFEPQIICKKINDCCMISTSYHLAFADKRNVLRPMINFYKSIIDFAITS